MARHYLKSDFSKIKPRPCPPRGNQGFWQHCKNGFFRLAPGLMITGLLLVQNLNKHRAIPQGTNSQRPGNRFPWGWERLQAEFLINLPAPDPQGGNQRFWQHCKKWFIPCCSWLDDYTIPPCTKYERTQGYLTKDQFPKARQ